MHMRQKMIRMSLVFTVALAGILFARENDAGSRKPNVIIIFTDDQGYEDLGVFGAKKIRTPNIDRMAGEGMRFTDFYSAASVCTPSRASLLTGCYPERVGNLGVLFPRDNKGLNPKETTIAKMLKSHGYATGCVGKWHLGHLKEFLPTSHGFDFYYGIPYSNDMTIAPGMKLAADLKLREGVTMKTLWTKKRDCVPLMRGDEVIEYPVDQNTLTKRYTEEAVQFIERNREKPFFLYMPHSMPHIPLYASAAFEGKSEAGLYGDCIEEIDWSVGQILAKLKALGLEQDTLIVYTSDNGPWDLAANATAKVKGNKIRRVGGSAFPLRGHKFKEWEGGMREPAVMWWPGRIPAGTVCSEIAGTIDLLPTIAAMSDAPLPENKIDGKNILPLLEGASGAKSPHHAYFYRTRGVRVGKWKLIKPNGSQTFELYDLSDDISESKNVAAANPEIVERLTKLLQEHQHECDTNSRPFGTVAKGK